LIFGGFDEVLGGSILETGGLFFQRDAFHIAIVVAVAVTAAAASIHEGTVIVDIVVC
jgi:hypothetical protein